MKGLLLKDFYTVKSMWRYILFIAVVFSISFGGRGDGTLAAMFAFISTILLLNSLAQDELDQWNKAALTMPVICRQIVLSKYLFALLLCTAGTVCGLVLTLLTRIIGLGADGMELEVVVLSAAVSSAVILLVIALMVPLNLKFGVQKSRLVLLCFVGIPVLLGLVADASGLQVPSMIYFGVSGVGLSMMAIGALVLLLFLSYRWSVRVLEKKEY